jgi:predicted transcriptional regulator
VKYPLAEYTQAGIEVVLSPPQLRYFLAVLAVYDRDGRVTQRAVMRQMGRRGLGPTNLALRKLRELGLVRFESGPKGGGTFVPCYRVELFREAVTRGG